MQNNNLKGKTPSQSRTEQVHLINQSSLNGAKRLFGGKIVSWIDVVAAVTARRHCGYHAVTAAIDKLSFLNTALADDLVILIGQVTYTHHSSMEICIKSYIEHADGSRTLINKAYMVMVALDKEGNKVQVPPIIPETDEEKEEYEAGKRRQALRLERRNEDY